MCLSTHYWQTVNCQFSQHPVLQTIEQCLQVTVLSPAASLILSCRPGAYFSPSLVFLQSPWTHPICKCPVQESKLVHMTASFYLFFSHPQDKVLLNRPIGHIGSKLRILLPECYQCWHPTRSSGMNVLMADNDQSYHSVTETAQLCFLACIFSLPLEDERLPPPMKTPLRSTFPVAATLKRSPSVSPRFSVFLFVLKEVSSQTSELRLSSVPSSSLGSQ